MDGLLILSDCSRMHWIYFLLGSCIMPAALSILINGLIFWLLSALFLVLRDVSDIFDLYLANY